MSAVNACHGHQCYKACEVRYLLCYYRCKLGQLRKEQVSYKQLKKNVCSLLSKKLENCPPVYWQFLKGHTSSKKL